MTGQLPAEKAGELILELNGVGDQQITPSRLNEIEEEANKLIDVDLSSAMVLLGVIAVIRRDLPEIDRCFGVAIESGDSSSFVIGNYAAALSNTGELERAIDLIDQVADDTHEIWAVRNAMDIHLKAFDADGAEVYRDLLRRMEVEIEESSLAHNLDELRDLFFKYGIDWKSAAHRVGLTMKTLLSDEVSIAGANIMIEGNSIVQRYRLSGEMAAVSRAESAMLDVLADVPFDPVDNILSFSCTLR